ncbi:MAG: signal recognition particle receptor subunit alpha, partial [Nocardioidaceae bacterium]|nr:signal recognition particle receptor subunit alpha [Nocardioidaceae bacterium]
MEAWLYLVLALAALALLVVVGFVTTRLRRRDADGKPEPAAGSDVLAPPAEPDVPDELAPEPEEIAEPAPPVTPTLERPEKPSSRLVRLRERLAGSNALGRGLLGLLSRDQLDEDTWEAIEDLLIGADIGVGPTQELVDRLRTRMRVEGGQAPEAHAVLREELVDLVDAGYDRSLKVSGEASAPGVVLVVGVNGTGKTTTVGKIARILVAEDRSALLAAADTFRAAATEQLATWGERVGVEVVRGPEGGDPASVAFDAVKQGTEQGLDTVVVDTAGRLQNKQ